MANHKFLVGPALYTYILAIKSALYCTLLVECFGKFSCLNFLEEKNLTNDLIITNGSINCGRKLWQFAITNILSCQCFNISSYMFCYCQG